MRFITRGLLLTIPGLLLQSMAYALEPPFINGSQPTSIEFQDSEHSALLQPILEKSLTQERLDQKLAGRTFILQKQARREREVLQKNLRAEGFYSSEITYKLSDKSLFYYISTGPRYVFRQVGIQANLTDLPTLESVGMQQGKPFRAETVLNAVRRLKQHVVQQHCLWRVEVEYDATVHHDSATADVILKLADSPTASFSEITIAGLTTLDPDYLRSKLGFKPGDCFKRTAVDKARLKLYQTGLLSGVESTLERTDDQVAVRFEVTERKHRTVKAGAGFSSDEGPYVTAGWVHRSFLGQSEKLELDARLSDLYRTAEAQLTIPGFLEPKQTLILGSELADEHLEAFDSNSLELYATVKRPLSKYLTASLGTRYKLTTVDDMVDEDTFGLWSFPASLSYDRRNDHLNPNRGWFLSGGVEPFIDTLDTGTVFVKTTLGASAYHTLGDWPGQPTLAVRGSMGTLNGQSIDDVPADERFYAGGGGSVRGYAFQLLGPLDADDEPIGGRSFAELSFESRWNLSPTWGAVAFVDGGNAYESITPDTGDGLRWAVGAGARYFTSFAPIRFDLAFPLDRRDGVDDSFQFYISIGQAF